MGLSINGTPKWMVRSGQSYYKMDDLGVHLGNLHMKTMTTCGQALVKDEQSWTELCGFQCSELWSTGIIR